MDNDEKKNSIEENIDNEQVDKGIPGDPVDGEVFQKTTKVIKIGSKLSITVTSKAIAIICGIAVLVAFIGAAIGIGLANGKGNGGDENNINNGENTDENEETECQHQYGEWVIDTDPECEAAGEKHRDCSLCDNRQIEAIPMTNHTPVTDAAVEPTCKSEGLTEGSHCSLCGHVFVSQQRIEKVEHEYDSENDESCNNCDYIRDVSCSHSETKIISGYGASCTTPGKTDGKKCSLCGEILVSQKQIPARGHSFADYSCRVCHTDQPAGLYDENEQLVASWDELVNTYGLKIEDDYNHWDMSSDDYYKDNPSSAYNVFNNPALSDGAKLIIGDEVTQIGKYAFYRAPIKDVFISKSIEFIGEGSFEHCEKLETVTFADGGALTAIDNFAFIKTAIEEIVLPDGLETLGSQVFGYCEQLKRVYISASVTEMVFTVFDDCPSIAEFVVDEENTAYSSIDGNLYNKAVTTIIKYAPAKADEVFVIPDSVEYIDYHAFNGVNKLKTLVIGQNVEHIAGSAFNNCTSIADFIIEWNAHYVTIDGNLYQKDYLGWYSDDLFLKKYAPGKVDPYFTVPDGVTDILHYAFSGNTNLVTVDIGEVEYICDQAFGQCQNLEMLIISNKLQTVEQSAFWVCDNLKTVLYSGSQDEWDGIQVLNEYENNNCLLDANIICNDNPGTEGFWYEDNGDGTCNLSGLSSYDYIENSDVLVIPAEYEGLTVTGISPSAFYYLDLQGKQLILPDTITSIGEYAFQGADMDSVYIPDSVLEICNRAFYCSYIREVILPDTLTTIGYEAFAKSEVELISIPESVTSIGALAFHNCERLHTLINRSSAEINVAFCDCTNLERIYWFTESWCDFTYDFEGSSSIKEFVIPYNSNSFRIIDGNVYNNEATFLLLYMPNNTQEIFVVPETVSSIDRLNCPNLKKIVLPAGLDYISFYNCPVLEYVEVSEDNERYMSINGSLYSKDGKILLRQAYTNGAKDIVIADGVTSIEAHAFESYKSVDSLFIPKSVSRFWEYAFHGEYEIKDVYYEGTEEEWQALFDNSYGNYYLFYEATVHYNCAR